MNTVSELKNLYTELGGNLTDTYEDIADGAPVGNYSVIPDCIAALAKIAGSTVELPAVTATDNGTLLGVVDGAWAKGLKIKKKQVSTEVTGNAINYLEFKLNSNNNDTQILGVMFTPETFTRFDLEGVSVKLMSETYGSYYGFNEIRLRYDATNGKYLRQGTYTLDVYYIEQ